MSNKYADRSRVVRIIFIVVFVLFVGRLAILQLFSSEYKEKAELQSLRNITQYPARGFIYDRHGELLVHNEAVYDLMVIPRMVKDLDTVLFCQSLGITRDDFEERMVKARKYSPYSASIFMKQISKEEYARFENKMFRFKGFYISQRTLRIYDRPIAAQVLGYVGEVNDDDLKRDPYYRMGDYRSVFIKWLLPPESTLHIWCPEIGPGAHFEHNYATYLNAEHIGRDFYCLQNVTLGNGHGGRPTIGNGVRIYTGAIVYGGISIGDNAVIGAGAVVRKDVPAGCTVAGNPAFIVKRDGAKVHIPL